MPALLSWILLLGGIATTVAAAALSAEVEFEVAIAMGGLLAALLGAVGLVLSRVAGDAPSALRPPGATARVNLPMGPPPTGRRRDGRSRSGGRGSVSLTPATSAIPTGPRAGGISRTPLLVAAFVVGIASDLMKTQDSPGPLDVLTDVLFIAAPFALVVAIATRLIGGHAWSPAVTVVMVTIAVFLGAVVAGMAASLLG